MDTPAQNPIETNLKTLIGDLVNERIGSPIYSVETGPTKTSVTPDNNYIESSPQKRIIHGIILKINGQTDNKEDQYVILAEDGSAMLVSAAKEVNNTFLRETIGQNKDGIEITPKEEKNKSQPIANIVRDNSYITDMCKTIMDISEDPENMTEVIKKAILFAKENKKRRMENINNAKPIIVESLKDYFSL